MLKYDSIYVSEGIDVSKTNGLHKCIICHYWYFWTIHFRFQAKVCMVVLMTIMTIVTITCFRKNINKYILKYDIF